MMYTGTTAEQDNRFSDKEKKLMKVMKFGDALTKRVDMTRVKLDTIKPWISKKITELLGMEDDVVVEFVFNQLEDEKFPDPKKMQINLTGFLNGKNARVFMTDLWELLLSAQESPSGIPDVLMEMKKEEIKKRMEEQERMHEISKKLEKRDRDDKESSSRRRDRSRDRKRSRSRDRRDKDRDRKDKERSKSKRSNSRSPSRSERKDSKKSGDGTKGGSPSAAPNDKNKNNSTSAKPNSDDKKKSRSPSGSSRSSRSRSRSKSRQRLGCLRPHLPIIAVTAS
uniref:Serine/arginine repetitive matrix protein 1 n=1 Tax=Lygus hesperus TaxID=30085 RepID=A0A0A9W5W4_LYGHE